jgi:hypothetical protein
MNTYITSIRCTGHTKKTINIRMKELRVLLALKLIKENHSSGFKEGIGSVPGMERVSADEMLWGPTKRASSWS